MFLLSSSSSSSSSPFPTPHSSCEESPPNHDPSGQIHAHRNALAHKQETPPARDQTRRLARARQDHPGVRGGYVRGRVDQGSVLLFLDPAIGRGGGGGEGEGPEITCAVGWGGWFARERERIGRNWGFLDAGEWVGVPFLFLSLYGFRWGGSLCEIFRPGQQRW